MNDKSVRCDQCGAEAWVTLGKGPNWVKYLDFCAHHYNKNSVVLHAEGWIISNDERHTINEKPSISANV